MATRLALLAGLLLFVTAGCNSSNLPSVEGTVTLDGKPLAEATVLFINSQTRPSAAKTDVNGFYRLQFSDRESGAVPGVNIVRITTAQGVGINEDGTSIPAVKERVPAKYNTKTTLQFDVQPKGQNVANWDLDSQGEILTSE